MWPVSVETVAYPLANAVLIAGYAIDPLNAPLPTACNLPFQPDAGSHTSMLMAESGVGVSVAATRQKAGTARVGAASPGGVKGPASTGRVSVIVAPGRDIVCSDTHEPLAIAVRADAVPNAAMPATIAIVHARGD